MNLKWGLGEIFKVEQILLAPTRTFVHNEIFFRNDSDLLLPVTISLSQGQSFQTVISVPPPRSGVPQPTVRASIDKYPSPGGGV